MADVEDMEDRKGYGRKEDEMKVKLTWSRTVPGQVRFESLRAAVEIETDLPEGTTEADPEANRLLFKFRTELEKQLTYLGEKIDHQQSSSGGAPSSGGASSGGDGEEMTDGQRKFLGNLGYGGPWDISKKDAMAKIDELKAQRGGGQGQPSAPASRPSGTSPDFDPYMEVFSPKTNQTWAATDRGFLTRLAGGEARSETIKWKAQETLRILDARAGEQQQNLDVGFIDTLNQGYTAPAGDPGECPF